MPTSAPPTESRGGFSLLEVLLALLVLGVLSALLAQVLQGSLQIHRQQTREPARLRAREADLARQLSGEGEEPVMRLQLEEDGE